MIREDVIVTTYTNDLTGHLLVGTDGLPTLFIDPEGPLVPNHYRPWTLPAAWSLRNPSAKPHTHSFGPLLTAWHEVENIRESLKMAQREAEQEAEAEIEERERARAIENAIAKEINERRKDETAR